MRWTSRSPQNAIASFLGTTLSIVWPTLYDLGCPVQAQVVLDGTLPSTISSPDQLHFVIEGGQRTTNTLFHSFEEFSIPTTGSAHFNHASDIETVIGRVTGDQISTIDGLLKANGQADVFLLNPNGFIFGPNARLDIGGSFLATTADRVLFEEQAVFSTSDPQAVPLLTVNAPVGLQMGKTIGNITFQGNGHQLVQIFDIVPAQNLASQPQGLQVAAGETLGFVGAGITVEGVTLMAPGGHIELGSVADGTVHFNTDGSFDYQTTNRVQDIQLSQQALIDVSATQAGSVHLYGANLTLTSGATILAQQQGSTPGGTINLQGTESVQLRGTAPGGTPRTQIRSETSGRGHGNGIQIVTPLLHIRNGSGIVTTTTGEATAGNLDVHVDTVRVTGFSEQAPDDTASSSTLATLSIGGTGEAGAIDVDADQVHLKNGGSIVSLTLVGEGNGGNISIQSPFIQLWGFNPRLTSGGISAATFGDGNAGNISIQTQRLMVKAGALIDSSTLAHGDAGNITIEATEQILIDGAIPSRQQNDGLIRSSINSIANQLENQSINIPGLPENPTGNAGEIFLQALSLHINNGGQVSVSVEGPGDSRELRIEANHISLGQGSRINATTTNGTGGQIRLHTDRLRLENSLINASVLDTGWGGDITIEARESITAIGPGSQVLRDTIIFPAFAGALDVNNINQGIWAIATGDGTPGDITIDTQELSLLSGSVLATATFGNKPGGNIVVNNAHLLDIQGSVLSSSSFDSGNAGDITINTERLLARDGGEILAATFAAGDAGNLVVNASESITLQGRSRSDRLFPSGLLAGAENLATGTGGDLIVQTPLLVIEDGAELSVSADDVDKILLSATQNHPEPPTSQRGQRNHRSSDIRQTEPSNISGAGTIEANVDILYLTGGSLRATSAQGEGGNINLEVANSLVMTDGSNISTQAGTDNNSGGNGGNITINSPFIMGFDDSDITANAFDGNGGNINIDTQGLFGLEFQPSPTPGNDITASSKFGLSGTVSITTPDIIPGTDATILSTTIVDPTQQIATACDATKDSRFVLTGQGGLPAEPNGDGDRPWTHILPDFGPIPESHILTPTPHPRLPTTELPINPKPSIRIQEATALTIAPNGSAQLIGGLASTIEAMPTCTPSGETG